MDKNYGLILFTLKNHPPKIKYRDDLIQCLGIALCSAARGYNPNISKFSTYAYRCLYGALCDFYGQENRKREVQEPADFKDDAGDQYGFELFDTSDLEEFYRERFIKICLNKLKPKQRKMVRIYYGIGRKQMKLREMGKKFNMTHQGIAECLKAAMVKMRQWKEIYA